VPSPKIQLEKAESRVRMPQPGMDMTDLAVVNNFEPEKELVAISFISPEDLERIHAPNGFFREVEPGYLHPQKEVQKHHVSDALDALEGRSTRSGGSSFRSTTSKEKGDLANQSLKFDDQIEVIEPKPTGLKKRSSIRNLFRRSKSEPQLESSKLYVLRQTGT
jgi:hypothetical protein